MTTICPPELCTACGACMQSCMRQAIRMYKGDNGFIYPVIEKTKCTDCGLCRKNCPAAQPETTTDSRPLSVFLAWNRNTPTRLRSSSGGLFSVIAEWTIRQGGVVYGAAYDEQMNVIHTSAENLIELEKLQGSKYVQSNIGDTLKACRKQLEQDRYVYFTGTPCQIAGLKSFLHKKYEKLITSDLVCHGVPSNELFQQQIHALENKHHYSIMDFRFRAKNRFGQGYDLQVVTKQGKRYNYNADLMPYFYGFWKNITLRESCYNCRYATTSRESDITLADFWLAKKVFPGVKTSKGLSLILLNTETGINIWNSIKEYVEYKETTLEQDAIGQGHLKAPVHRPEASHGFLQEYSNGMPFDKICRKFLTPSLKDTLKCRAKNIIKILIGFKYLK